MYKISKSNQLFKMIAGGWVFQSNNGYKTAMALCLSGGFPKGGLVILEN